jgi:hypothetical protein
VYNGLNWFRNPADLPADDDGHSKGPLEPVSGRAQRGVAAAAAGGAVATGCTPQGGVGDEGVSVATTGVGRVCWISSEYSVPVHRLHDAVSALDRALSDSHRGRLVELKFVGACGARSLLGCNSSSEDACCLNVWWRADVHPPQLAVRPFEQVMQQLGAIPHWGKLHTLPPGYVARALGERADRFAQVSQALDPARMFARGWC